ncbi:MAG: hypothetical protein IJM14_03605 [Lachnospiraceae bacterium]|nr:hypothetical protein [Lachnospiraceae bacterium]
MEKIETIEDFRRFVERNRDLIREKSVEVCDLPEDDDWINDDEWDVIYEREVKTRKRN